VTAPRPDETTGPPGLVHTQFLAVSQSAPSPTAFPAGTRVGKYEIIRVLGRGGMGQVYLARDVLLGRRVAIKFMLDTRAAFVERFDAEARATARCQHENIVVIYDIGDYHGHGFMVLEYLEGETLSRTIANGAQVATVAIELMIPVARALAHAHQHGLVHRDLKPDNVFVTVDGSVKVLDFGIASAFDTPEAKGTVIGTPLYMAPEQHAGEGIDHRADLWAFGICLYELVTGVHPLGPEPDRSAIMRLADPSLPLPSTTDLKDVPADVARVIDRCLAKTPDARFATATELVDALEACITRRATRSSDVSPYPGLSAFGDGDADVFFGRAADVRRGLQRLRDAPMLGIVGPSGVGKSSFVRAGLGTALVEQEGWHVLASRPGRDPLRGLAELAAELSDGDVDADDFIDRLRAEPGYLAELMRSWVRRTKRRVLVFVDQFEELFTLVPAIEDRVAYIAALVAIADDVAAPLRVVVAMRSDFLDRIAESPELTAHLSRNLMFLSPLDRASLRESLTQPAKLAGYAFESAETVDDILDALEHTNGALPLLQFVASLLWDERDKEAKTLTARAYRSMGGVVGAIAAHADQTVADLAPGQQREVRHLFQRMVTPDKTRALVELKELTSASNDSAATRELIDRLVAARLLVMNGHGDERTVEIVHDSLITGWPRLAVWIEEEHEILLFASELRTAARQWDERGRPVGLVWRGEVLADARRLRTRLEERGSLGERERLFLDAAVSLDERALRARRRLFLAGFAVTIAIAVGAIIAMLLVRDAERDARFHAERAARQSQEALKAQLKANDEEANAQLAEKARISEAERRQSAEQQARTSDDLARVAQGTVAKTAEELAVANKALQQTADDKAREAEHAKAAQKTAEAEAARAQKAEEEVKAKQAALQQLLQERDARVKKLEDQLKKISTDLK
jgi:hypothetical protein